MVKKCQKKPSFNRSLSSGNPQVHLLDKRSDALGP
jgi:hypothetical protein